MVFADTGGLSWKEVPEDRERGEVRVVISSFNPDGNVAAFTRLILRQKDIEAEDAESEVAALLEGQPIECRFFDPGQGRLFAIVCSAKGAKCEVVE